MALNMEYKYTDQVKKVSEFLQMWEANSMLLLLQPCCQVFSESIV